MHHSERSMFRHFAGVLFAAIVTLLQPGAPAAQELVVTPAIDAGFTAIPRPVVVIPDLGTGLPNPPRNYVMPLDFPLVAPHGLALVAANRALATHMPQSGFVGIDLIDTATGTRIDSFALPQPTPTTFYDGYGTLAVNPTRTHVLAVTSLNTLWVIPAPFDHTATVTMLALPSATSTPQTRAIAFDGTTGRAYIALVTGIAVVDPPYTSVAFTIPSANGVPTSPIGPVTGAIALSPDNATLVATRAVSGAGLAADLRIFHAPFSAASVPDVLNIAGASLDGLTFTPDGSKVLVVEQAQKPAPALPRVYAVSAPFSAASTVETLQFDTGGNHDGFEDVDISADGQLAALSGGGGAGAGDPLIVLKAPFTAAGFSFTKIDLPQFSSPYSGTPGRGNGTARFWSAPIPALPPQVWVDFAATSSSSTGGVLVTEGNSGTTDALVPVNLSAPSTQTVTVDYTTVDGSATAADNDYIPITGTLTFAPGEITKNIVVKVVGDTIYEYDERFTVVISNPVNAALISFAATGTVGIVNDDAVVPLAITTTALPDGVAGTPYSFQLMATGVHPLTWSISSNIPPLPLPAGLSLDAATGIISGIPTTPITLPEFVKVTDPIGKLAFATLSLTITGSGIPVLTPSPDPLDFGSRTVGTTSPIKTSLVTNTGSANLVLGNPYITTGLGTDFTLASSTCTNGQTLAPGAQCQLNFTFTPQGTGTRSVTLDFNSNAAPASLTLTGVGTDVVPPVSAVSRKAHGAAGTFDLPLSGVPTDPTTEPRMGPNHTIVIPFASSVSAATATITEGVATAGTPTFSGNEVIVVLTGVADQQYVTLTLTNVVTAGGTTSGSVRLGFLVGDVNQSRVVLVSDLGFINAQLTRVTTAANFLLDVNASGAITVADKGITNANLTKSLPPP